MTIRDRFAQTFANTLLATWKTATDEEIVDKAVRLADALSLRLAMGDPAEQELSRLVRVEAEPQGLSKTAPPKKAVK
jgi:formylmethanofuran:tetrahydromethanopterin formyltransferase